MNTFEHIAGAIPLTALRKDGLIGNPPNFKVDSDVEDAKGAIAEKQAEAAKIKAEEPPKVESPKAEPPKAPQKKGGLILRRRRKRGAPDSEELI